jgi:hypothetical protein
MLVIVILAALAWTKRAERETTVAENTDQLLLEILIKCYFESSSTVTRNPDQLLQGILMNCYLES